METKLFEVRDSMTYMPCLATRLESNNEAVRHMLATTGYGLTDNDHRNYVIFGKVAGGENLEFNCDSFIWKSRTMQVAHQYIVDNWNDLENGGLIDVEFILGLTSTPKISESILRKDYEYR